MRYVGFMMLVWLALPIRGGARDIYVNNVAGDDRFDGSAAVTQGARIGPCRTLTHALKLADKSDRVILAATGQPYRESVTLQAGRHSGVGEHPFEIIGSGAVLDGLAPVPQGAWTHAGDEVYRFSPPRMSFQLLYLDGRPATRVPVGPADLKLPTLKPRQWCLFQRHVYFRSDAGQTPGSYQLEYCALPVGITLYEVRNVVIRDLIVQGFQLDGINAHDGVFDALLTKITCRGNARSGISVGGASRIQIAECLAGGNGEAQLRTEGWSHTRLANCRLLDDTAPRVQSEPDSEVIEQGQPGAVPVAQGSTERAKSGADSSLADRANARQLSSLDARLFWGKSGFS